MEPAAKNPSPAANDTFKSLTVWGVYLTPKLKAHVLKEGQRLFATPPIAPVATTGLALTAAEIQRRQQEGRPRKDTPK